MFQVLQDAQGELDRVTSIEQVRCRPFWHGRQAQPWRLQFNSISLIFTRNTVQNLQESVMRMENELQSAKDLHRSCIQDINLYKSRDDSSIATSLRQDAKMTWQRDLNVLAEGIHSNLDTRKSIMADITSMQSGGSRALLDSDSLLVTLAGDRYTTQVKRDEARARARQAEDRFSMTREDHEAAERAVLQASLRLVRAKTEKDSIMLGVHAARETFLAVSSLQQAKRGEVVAAEKAAEEAAQQATAAAAKLQAALKRKAQLPAK